MSDQTIVSVPGSTDPVHADVSETPFRVILITDLVDSTAVAVEHGDRAYLAAIDDHHRLVRRQLDAHGAHEFDTTGDGIIAWSDRPADAAACALAIVLRAHHCRVASVKPFELRVGLAGGQPIERDGYLYGATPNLAARLAAEAGPNEIVTDEGVRRRSEGVGRFDPLGGLSLKGFPEPVPAHSLTPSAPAAA